MFKKPKTTADKTRTNKMPSAWSLSKNTINGTVAFWRPLAGVLAVYAALYLVLVMGFNLSLSWQQELALTGNRFADALDSVFSVFGSSALSGGSESDATILVQFLLFLVASLAFTWALRRLQAKKDIKIADAYYVGAANLIQALIVAVVLLVVLLPLVIGSGLLSASLQAGASGGEVVTVSLIAGILLLISFYLLAMLWPAFYIISLPGSRPWASLKSAAGITKRRRFAILRKILSFAFVVFAVFFVAMFLVALVIASIVPAVVFLLLIALFGFTHIYLYSLYRSLL